jgi:hypothetical protein
MRERVRKRERGGRMREESGKRRKRVCEIERVDECVGERGGRMRVQERMRMGREDERVCKRERGKGG